MSYGDDIEGAVESIVDDRITSALEDYDPTDNYSFNQAVESVVDDRIDSIDLDTLGVRDYIDEAINDVDVSDQVKDVLLYHTFSSEDVEDFDSAVEYVVQGLSDGMAYDTSALEQRVSNLEDEVKSLVETNKRLLAALLNNEDEDASTDETNSSVTFTLGETVPAFPDFAAAAI